MGLVFALAIPTVAGILLASLFLNGDRGFGFLDRLFFGFGLGLGLLTFETFLVGLVGLPFTLPILTSVQAATILLLLYLVGRSGSISDAVRGNGIFGSGQTGSNLKGWKLYLCVILACWISLRIGFVFYESMTRPIYSWDAWGNWSAGAKLFYYERGLVIDPAHENFFGTGYRAFLGHPLHTPLLQVWMALWLGQFHEVYVKAWSAFYYLSLLGLMLFALRREGSWTFALMGVFFLSSAPLLLYHGTGAYSDLPLSYVELAAAVCFWRYLETGNVRLVSLAAVFVSMGVLTKNEGLFYLTAMTAALVVFLAFERKGDMKRGLLSFLIPMAMLVGPWLLFKAYFGFGFGHSDAASGLTYQSALDLSVIGAMVMELLFRPNFNLIIPLWLAVTVLGRKVVMDTNIKYLYIVIIPVIAMFVFVYMTFQFEKEAVTKATGLHRNTLTYVPLIFFSSCLLIRRLWPSAADDR